MTERSDGSVALQRLVMRWKRWRQRRRWPVTRQLQWLRQTIQEDHRWMAHDPKIKALTERYLSMLVDEWEAVGVEDVRRFRERIGAKPRGGA